jgi:lysyl-tRNA synthetase class 2
MSQPSPWWNPERHADRRPLLVARGRIKAAIREWFQSEGFTEVEPGLLQVSPGNETHLHAFRTLLVDPDLRSRELYLHTSPEFTMKKLLAAGETKIFAFSPVFRNRERGNLHSPEFTMLEWYRADEPYRTLWDDCARILKIAADVTGNLDLTFRGRSCNPTAPPHLTSVEEAFSRLAQIDLRNRATNKILDRDAFAAEVRRADIRIEANDTWSDIFSRVLVERIDDRLGVTAPTILYEYPAIEAALARPVADDPEVAERFELFACGVELANGFGELTDAGEQRRRFESSMTEKQRLYGERYPIDEDFLEALTHMPPASGCAMGFDRLVMLATGAERIDQVIWTPFVEQETGTR